MRIRLRWSFLLYALIFPVSQLLAAVPVISYSPSTNTYTVGTAITTLTPTVTNGVSAMGFGSATALTGATLNNPRGVGIDASGNIYVTNSGNNTISKYNSSGTYLGTFGSGATLSSPKDIIFDSSGNAYVLNLGASAGTGSVYKYNASGVYQSTIISGLNYALGITIDASDNIYIADQGAVTVKKYNTSGTLLLSLPTANLSTPLGVAVDAPGNIYVLNNGSGTVTKYNSAGTFQSTFLSGFTSAQSITIDGAGNFYVGDNPTTNTVYVYNPSGTLLTSKAITDPEGIAVDAKGDIFSSAYYANQVNETKPTGGFFLSGALPAGLSFNSTTGAISGTPTATMATTVFTVTAYNASGSGTTTVSITVVPTAPTGTGGSTCSSGSVTLTASGGSPAGGAYSWYATVSGGSSLGTGSSFATSAITTTTTYYVDYTVGGVTSTPRTAVTATVNSGPVLATAPTSPTSGLYLSYSFNGNANDVSGNSNNGTLQGAPALTTDRYNTANSAYSFNGSSQYISTASSFASPGPQNFSISVWFKTTTAGGKLVGYGSSQTGSSGSYDRQIYMSNTGQIYFGLYPNVVKTLNTTASYNDGNWHNVIATVSTTNGSNLYVDGALQASDATMTTSQTFSVNGYWRVGYDNLAGWTNTPTDYYFTGALDDIAIYNSALTASQVYSLYGAGSAPVCAGNTLSLQVNSVSGTTYSWTSPNGFSSTSQNPTVSTSATTAMAGTYTCTVTNATGCSSSINVTAVVNSAASATFTASSSVNTNTNATITYTGSDPSTSTYSWDFGGGTPSTGTGQGPFMVQWSTVGTKTITLTVTNSSGCSTTSTQRVVVGLASYGNYAFAKQITLNTTSLGITSNLTNFPALLSITDNDLIISGACTDKVYNPNGPNYDFAFVSGGSELYYQVESYNTTTGTLLVWVQIPSLTYATNSNISFYYGSTSPTVTHNTAFFQKTWSSDYLAVFHESETSYTGTTSDGTANGHAGTLNNMSSANLVTGKIGNAYSFNGSSTSLSTTAATITGPFTISAWVKLNATGLDQKIITNQTSSGGTSGGYKLGVYTTNYPETESGTAQNRSTTPNPTAFTIGTWYYVQGVYDGSTLSTYVNGVMYKATTSFTNPSSTGPLYIGVGEGGNQYYWNGVIDEARVSNVAKSSDWLKAEYGDQNNPSPFTSISSTSTVNTTNASSVPGALTYTWTGGAGTTDPTNAGNWTNTTAGTTNQAPSFNGDQTLVIPAGVGVYPSLTSNESIYGLTIASGASLNLNGYTLSVGCNIYNSSGGQILYGSSNTSGITWNGSTSSQTYTGTNTSNTAQLGSMTINNSAGGTVTISNGPVDIYNSLTITKGNLVVGSSPAALTLKSTATQSASVAAIPSGYSITGNVSVERYLTGGSLSYRSYRLLSSPVYASTVSGNNVYSINYLKNSIFLTGTSTTGGFDNTSAANPTLYLYRENLTPLYTTFLNSNFRGINNINAAPTYSMDDSTYPTINIPVGSGYLCFFRGNRASASFGTETTTTYIPQTVTLTASGTLNQGQITVKDWFTPSSFTLSYTAASPSTVRGYNLVGNPYASSIDWETFQSSSSTSGIYGSAIGNAIYVLDPLTHNYGAYVKGNGGSGTNNASNVIASGQGFFVVASSASATLIFNESAKTTAQPTSPKLLMSSTTVATNSRRFFRLQFAKDSVNTEDILIRLIDTLKNLNYNDDVDAVYKRGLGKVSMCSVSSDNYALAIFGVPAPLKKPDAIPLNIETSADGAYTIKLQQVTGIPQLYDIWLMDAYKKDSLDMRLYPSYAFNIIQRDTMSYGRTRFKLVLRINPAYAYHLLSFTAAKVPDLKQVKVNWTSQNEQNYTDFTVERSTDNGKSFDAIGVVPSSGQNSYGFIDKTPVDGQNWYRLKSVDITDSVQYSAIVKIGFSYQDQNLKTQLITIYPNPVASVMNLTIDVQSQHTYALTITNSLGLVVRQFSTTQNVQQLNTSDLTPGAYVLKVIDTSDQKFIGSAKFIKL